MTWVRTGVYTSYTFTLKDEKLKTMKIRTIFAILLLLGLVSGTAMAKDDVLVQDMIDLERVYIPALFLTSQNAPTAVPAFNSYESSWNNFRDEYGTYRSSERNWIDYFDTVQDLVDYAGELVVGGHLLEAHEVLELVRTTMRELRMRNGFPKFNTDELTAFHSIMGEIIAISIEDFDGNTIDTLYELYRDASHAWFKVEKNSVDQDAWVLTDDEMLEYSAYVQAERTALDTFEMALIGGDVATIRLAAMGLKPAQAKAYLLLGDL